MKETFSVYSKETEDGLYTKHNKETKLEPEPAVKLAKSLIDTGKYFNVWIVCDQDDCTVFDWNKNEGLVFPKL